CVSRRASAPACGLARPPPPHRAPCAAQLSSARVQSWQRACKLLGEASLTTVRRIDVETAGAQVSIDRECFDNASTAHRLSKFCDEVKIAAGRCDRAKQPNLQKTGHVPRAGCDVDRIGGQITIQVTRIVYDDDSRQPVERAQCAATGR